MNRIFKKIFMAGCVIVLSLLGVRFVQQGRQDRSYEPFIAHTIYGDFQVTEPVLIDLFKSPIMQRIKGVRQYGVVDYVIKQNKEYTRYEHCVGVWGLLRKYGASLEEQIAGLLHDASHTVFSHVGDVLFAHRSADSSYQDDIQEWYLKKLGADELLAKYNIPLEAVLDKNGAHTMLEQALPDICVDRLEYNLHAGLLTNLLSRKDIDSILNDICWEHGRWFFRNPENAKKLALVSLFNTEHVWGGVENNFIYARTADALKRALEIGILTPDDIHFSTDGVVWDKLWISDDPMISHNLNEIVNYKKIVMVTSPEESHYVVTNKFRGLNPWVKQDGVFKRLTDLDSDYEKEYNRVKGQVTKGWYVCLRNQENDHKPYGSLAVA